MPKTKTIIHFIVLLVLLAGNIYLRLYPVFFPQLYQRAVLNVAAETGKEIEANIRQQYPEMSEVVRSKIVAQVLQKEKKTKLFQEKVSRQYRSLKGRYQDENGQTYLAEVDPYAWLRATRLVLAHGYPGTSKTGRTVYDSFMFAPQGRAVQDEQFLFYSAAFLYRLSHRLVPHISLPTFLFYLPLFFTIVFLISLYAFCRYFFSRATGLIAVFFVGLSPALIDRSSAGWFDADVLCLLFPLLIVWLLALSQRAPTRKATAVFSLLAAAVLSVYATTWVGWWFIFLVILVYFCLVFAHTAILHRRDLSAAKRALAGPLVSCAVFLLASVIGCLLIRGIEPFWFLWHQIRANLGLDAAVSDTIWPNVYYTVMELKKGDVFNIPELVGNWPLFVFALGSLLWMYIRQRRSRNAAVIVMFTIWILFMFAVSLKGIRFSLFLVVPIGIFLAEGLRSLGSFIWLKAKHSRSLWVKSISLVTATAVIYLITVTAIRAGIQEASVQIPMLTDSWYSFLSELRVRTEKDAILNGWWDHGNWYKEVAQRRALFDPQSQNTPISYWLAKVFLATDEAYALRVLRMLNNSSDTLFDDIRQHMGDAFSSIAFLNKILAHDAAAADELLAEYQIPPALGEKIKTAIFFKRPAPAYLIVYKSMIYQMRDDTFIANWDFAKVYALQNKARPKQEVVEGLRDIFSLPEATALAIYDEAQRAKTAREKNEMISRRWVFNPPLAEGSDSGKVVYFNNGIIFEKDSRAARIFSFREKRYKKFSSTLYFDGEQLQVNTYADAQLISGALIIKTEHGWQSLGYLHRQLGQSLFSRLFFMKAKELKHFEPFAENKKAGIYAYRVIWD